MPIDTIEGIGFKMERHPANSNPYPNRFKNVAHLSRSETDKEGVTVVATTENGHVLVDFGKPIQTLGMNEAEGRAFIMMIVEGLMVAALKGSVSKDKAN